MENGRILIVDDTPMNIKALAAMLKEDYKITFATNGEKALEILKKCEKPNLILLDVMMPGIDGYEVCRHLKKDLAYRNIPVIFITARTDEADVRKGMGLGAAAYITKPFDAATVRQIVKTHIWLAQD